MEDKKNWLWPTQEAACMQVTWVAAETFLQHVSAFSLLFKDIFFPNNAIFHCPEHLHAPEVLIAMQ